LIILRRKNSSLTHTRHEHPPSQIATRPDREKKDARPCKEIDESNDFESETQTPSTLCQTHTETPPYGPNARPADDKIYSAEANDIDKEDDGRERRRADDAE
jgi:hypothetical protein